MSLCEADLSCRPSLDAVADAVGDCDLLCFGHGNSIQRLFGLFAVKQQVFVVGFETDGFALSPWGEHHGNGGSATGFLPRLIGCSFDN